MSTESTTASFRFMTASESSALVGAPRACGNCRHRSTVNGKCRNLGSVLVGYRVGETSRPCAWHRTEEETEPLSSPCQIAPRSDLARIGRCMYPKDMPRRAGWTDRAAGAAGCRPILAPAPRQHALAYTQTPKE